MNQSPKMNLRANDLATIINPEPQISGLLLRKIIEDLIV